MDFQDDKQDTAEKNNICLKCETHISHVPYKFGGNLFHARCLLCDACRKRLIGKPFVTSGKQIFCDTKCLELFKLEDPKIQLSEVIPNGCSNHISIVPHLESFSIGRVVDSMQNHTHHFSREGHDPIPYSLPPGRMTDYPVGGSVGVANHNHSFQSETDSLSESSFTSDSSFAYDANRKPKKKILKKSNVPRRKHKHHVRWNLDNLESFSDDNASLDSSSSVSSSGRSYYRAQEQPFRVAENGRIPDITQSSDYQKHLQNNHSVFNSNPTSNPTGVRDSTNSGPSLNPGIYRTYSGSIYKPNPTYLPGRQTGSLDNHYRPLSRPALNRSSPFSNSYQDLQQTSPQTHLRQSTPISSPRLETTGGTQLNRSMERVINVPVLHLDENSITELETSNIEERRQRHLFEFPQQRSPSCGRSPQPKALSTSDLTYPNTFQRSRTISDASNPQSLNSNSSSSISSVSTASTPPVSSPFLPVSLRSPSSPADLQGRMNHYPSSYPLKRVPEDDQEPDYDHLSEDSFSFPVVPTAEQRLKPIQLDNQWYSDDDIEEALQIIEESEHDDEEETDRSKASPIVPPPVPPKQRKYQTNRVPLKTPPPPVPPKKQALANVLAQEVTLNESSLNETVDGLILSPPQEFKGSSDPQNHQKQDPLHSPSCETLMPNDTPQSDPNLDQEEVHPENRASLNLKYSWAEQPPKIIDDRIIEGAEDPERQQSPTCVVPKEMSSGFVPHISKVNTNLTDQNNERHRVEVLTNGIGGLSLNDHISPPHMHSFSPKLTRQGEEAPRQYQFKRSKTLPKNLTPVLTKEEEAVLQWRKKRPQMKPLIVDTDKEIEELMAEMDTGGNMHHHTPTTSPKLQTEKRGYFGECCVCKRTIETSSSLVDFASRKYHSSCLCCSHCGCMLKGTQIFTLQGVLMCATDYNRIITQQHHQKGEQPSKPLRKLKSSRGSSSSLLRSRDDVVISPPMQTLGHVFNNKSSVNSTTVV